MRISQKRREALKRDEKRRARRGVVKFLPPPQSKAAFRLQEQMVSLHQDVLQNIESVLVAIYSAFDDLDDEGVARALRCGILQAEPEDLAAKLVLEVLNKIRRTRDDVSDEVWADGLRVVYSSVKRHSACRSGDTDYLDFVSEFVH